MNDTFKLLDPQPLTGTALLALLPVLKLTPAERRDMASAIAAVIAIAGRPADEVMFTCEALNALLYKAAPRVLGLSPDRHGEIVSLLRRLLRLVDQHAPLEKGPHSLKPAWRTLHDALGPFRQLPLIDFMRFCSQADLAPEAVTPATLAEFERWCTTRKLGDDPAGKGRRVASNWTWAVAHVPGWPAIVLTRPSMCEHYTLPLDAYPAEFVADVHRFTERLACQTPGSIFTKTSALPRASPTGHRSGRSRRRPLRPRTISTRLHGILFAAAALPFASVHRLRDLVVPVEKVKQILTFHIERLRKRHGEQAMVAGGPDVAARASEIVQSSHLGTIAETLRQIACFHCDPPLAAEDLAQITEWVGHVTPERQTTMTPKNRERLRGLIQPDKLAMFLHLPQEWLRQAAEIDRGGGPKLTPKAAAIKALYALVLEILLVCPLRRDNLAHLRLDVQLLRNSPGARLITDIQIDATEVKNGRMISWPLPEGLSRMMQVFIERYRPLLLDGTPNMYLFPGARGQARNAGELGTTLSELVTREIGTAINTHLMRHFAAWRYLKRHVGAYEIIRLVLGHSSVATVIKSYAGLEADAAAKHFSDELLQDRRETRATAAVIFGKRRGRPPGSKNKPKTGSPK